MKLKQTSKSYFVNSKKNFEAKKIDFYTVEKCFSFAHNMIWGDGHHRVKRSGGQQLRTKGEMFANTLQGKIAEYIVYQEFTQHGFSDIEEPDTDIHGDKYLLKSKHLLFSNDVTIDQLKKLVFNEQWFYDVAGVCSLRSIKYVIKNKYPQVASSFFDFFYIF